MQTDTFHLQRFVEAQSPTYAQVKAELTAGHKRTHWIWFIFPQIRGLGSSPMAQHFAIGSRAEAEAYLAHPILDPRLRECTALVNAVAERQLGFPLEAILPSPDDLKFRSSMTLFANVTERNALFLAALTLYFAGEPDQATLDRL